MPSKKRIEPLAELERDLALSPEENEALWRIRRLNAMDPHEYLRFLLAATKDMPASRQTPPADTEPFEL
jgi:hypothetical protein